MEEKANKMNKILSIGLLVTGFWLLCTSSSESRSITDERRREFFHEEIAQEQTEEKALFEILSVSKSTLQDYIYDSGPGTRQVRSIELRFKINRAGELRIPYLYVYLYDSKKGLIQRLERIYLKEVTKSREIDPNNFPFKGKKTYVVQFDHPNEIPFKYYLAVIGNDEKISVEVKPGNVEWRDFEFAEKEKIHSSSD